MRYYYYGAETDVKARDVRGMDTDRTKKPYRYDGYQGDGLVVEEDTIYEIDWDCERCRRAIGASGKKDVRGFRY